MRYPVELVSVRAGPELCRPQDEIHGRCRRCTTQSLRELWRDQPVRERLLCSLHWRLYPLAKWVRAHSRRTGQATEPFPTDLANLPSPANGLLKHLLASETNRILAAMAGRGWPKSKPFLSLLAVLERATDLPAAELLRDCRTSGDADCGQG